MLAHYVVSLLSSFFFNDTAPTEIYTLSLHDALPISKLMDLMRQQAERFGAVFKMEQVEKVELRTHPFTVTTRSEEHTSELQSLRHLVCRLLLEKKKKIKKTNTQTSQYRQIKQHA